MFSSTDDGFNASALIIITGNGTNIISLCIKGSNENPYLCEDNKTIALYMCIRCNVSFFKINRDIYIYISFSEI